MARFKFVIKTVSSATAKRLMEIGVLCYLLYDKKEKCYFFLPAEGLHKRKGFRCEKET
jgi:hypothetical protein